MLKCYVMRWDGGNCWKTKNLKNSKKPKKPSPLLMATSAPSREILSFLLKVIESLPSSQKPKSPIALIPLLCHSLLILDGFRCVGINENDGNRGKHPQPFGT